MCFERSLLVRVQPNPFTLNMKSASEMAKEVVRKHFDWLFTDQYQSDLAKIVAEALHDFADAKVNEAIENIALCAGQDPIARKIRNEALEEAAQVAEYHSGPSINCATKIRALKHSAQTDGK